MKNNLLDKALQSLFSDKVKSFGYLPRWIILIIDVLILIFANSVTYIMLLNLNSRFYPALEAYQRYSLIIAVNVFFFFFYKTYAGIIRHSSFVDAVKLFLATFSSIVLLGILNYANFYIFGQKIFLFPGLIMSFVLSFTFLFLFRMRSNQFCSVPIFCKYGVLITLHREPDNLVVITMSFEV